MRGTKSHATTSPADCDYSYVAVDDSTVQALYHAMSQPPWAQILNIYIVQYEAHHLQLKVISAEEVQ